MKKKKKGDFIYTQTFNFMTVLNEVLRVERGDYFLYLILWGRGN